MLLFPTEVHIHLYLHIQDMCSYTYFIFGFAFLYIDTNLKLNDDRFILPTKQYTVQFQGEKMRAISIPYHYMFYNICFVFIPSFQDKFEECSSPGSTLW